MIEVLFMRLGDERGGATLVRSLFACGEELLVELFRFGP
jgi:hypothetical protein